MIRLILARHGNTFEDGQTPLQIGLQTDLPLTEKGRDQAKKMAECFPKIDAGFSGTLKRQKEFAQIVCEEVKEESCLNEIDYGLWEGLNIEEIRKRWPREQTDWNESAIWPLNIFKGDPSLHLVALRNWMKSLFEGFDEQSLIFSVTSGGILKLLYPQKVATGHFCELELFPTHFLIKSWNTNPQADTLRI